LTPLSYSAKQYVETNRDGCRFNKLNTPNNIFGIITAQNNQPREAQFALRLRF
jgi:hypothetical protein